MFLRFEATLNGSKFSEIADEVILTDIIEEPASVDVTLARWANRPGQRLSAKTRTALSVRLVYVIRTQDIARRAEVRDLIAKWGKNGGQLTVNTRPNLYLDVTMDTPPALDSSLKWTQELTLTLTAYRLPYWVSNTLSEALIDTVAKSDGSGYVSQFASITLDGTVDSATVDCFVSNIGSENLTRLYIKLNNTFMELTGLSVEPSKTIIIEHSYGVVTIRDMSDDTVSYLYARTPQSSDELLGIVGHNNVYVEANTQVSVYMYGAGWWL